MASDLVAVFMHKNVLEAEIERLRAGHSLAELDLCGLDGEFCQEVEELEWPNDSIQFRHSCGPFHEALGMNRQLVEGAQTTGKKELMHAADALARHFGAFSCGMCSVLPYNEYALKRCTIIHAESAARLHQTYEQTTFEPLRPLFADYCRIEDIGLPYRWITSFDGLLDYAKVFDALLRQAADSDKTLYVFVSY